MKPNPNRPIPEITADSQCVKKEPNARKWRLVLPAMVASMLLAVGSNHAKEGPGMPAVEHLGLTQDYLAGEWCFTHVQFPKERSEENIRYRFDPDGTFATQNTPGSKMRAGFFYQYKPEGKIKLATIAGFLKVAYVKPDTFALHLFGDMTFQRGLCK